MNSRLDHNTFGKALTLCIAQASLVFALAASWLALPAGATPPGEDTVIITSVKNNAIAGGPPQPGKGLPERYDMPINVKAKIARYTAVAMQKPEEYANSVSIEQTAESAGFNKTCIQDVGSNTVNSAGAGGTGGGRFGPRAQDQIVVLRGDLVNICR
jgi:hypothetical protein